MKVKLSLFFLVLLIASSCGKKTDTTEKIDAEVFSDTFNVILEATIKKDDKVMLYFQDETIAWFDDDHFVERSVIGQNKTQSISLSVPEGYDPTNIRIDLSSVAGQDPIEIKRIILKYRDRNFVIDQANFANYFKPNDYIDFDNVTNTATFIVKEDQTYDPILFPTEEMTIAVANLTKK